MLLIYDISFTDFAAINISDHELGKHYFNMLAELNKYYGFQCSVSSPSGLNWSTASSTRPSISGGQEWGRTFATGNSTFLNSCLIELLLFGAKFKLTCDTVLLIVTQLYRIILQTTFYSTFSTSFKLFHKDACSTFLFLWWFLHPQTKQSF